MIAVFSVTALALGVAATASAEVVISTLANTPVGTDNAYNTNAAQGFFTGGQAEVLKSVTLELLGGDGSATVSLLSDSGFSSPGSLAENLGTINPTGGYSQYTLAAPAFTLAPDTNYWVAVAYDHTVTPDSPGPWAYLNPKPPYGSGYTATGSGFLTYLGESYDGGASWWTASSAVYGPYMVAVNAAAVPEPTGIIALLGIGGMGLISSVWRRRRAAV